MKGKDIVKLIQDAKLEDYHIVYMEIDDDYDKSYISSWKDYKKLPYPEFVDFIDGSTAETYESKVVDFNTKNGSILEITNAHVDSSTEEFYPY